MGRKKQKLREVREGRTRKNMLRIPSWPVVNAHSNLKESFPIKKKEKYIINALGIRGGGGGVSNRPPSIHKDKRKNWKGSGSIKKKWGTVCQLTMPVSLH